MKILMFGAGVIGTIYGYALSKASNQVIHYVRPGKKKQHYMSMQKYVRHPAVSQSL